MYGCESWTTKKAECWSTEHFQTVVLEKSLESSLDCKEIKQINPKEDQPWIFIRRTDAEAPIFWLPDVKSRLIRKDPDAGKDWRQEEKGMTEDEMVGWLASPTQWTWVWANSRRLVKDRKPGVLQSMGLQRVRHDWATEQQEQWIRNTVKYASYQIW